MASSSYSSTCRVFARGTCTTNFAFTKVIVGKGGDHPVFGARGGGRLQPPLPRGDPQGASSDSKAKAGHELPKQGPLLLTPANLDQTRAQVVMSEGEEFEGGGACPMCFLLGQTTKQLNISNDLAFNCYDEL